MLDKKLSTTCGESTIIVSRSRDVSTKLLTHVASLALWAGGNELESLMLPIAKAVAPSQYDRLVGEYEKLFIDTLTPAVFANSRSISYTPSSTSNGWLELNFTKDPLRPFTERYNNVTVGSIYGDTEYDSDKHPLFMALIHPQLLQL